MSVGWVPFWLAPPGFFWRFSWFIIFSCLFVFSTTCQLLLPSVIVTTLVLNTKRMRSTAACFSSQLLSRWIGQDTIEPSCQITLFFSEWVGRLLWEVVALSIGLKPSTTSQIRKGKPVNSTSDVQPSFMEKRTSGPKLFWYFGWLFSFFYIVLFESLPNTRFICMRVGCPRTRPRHGTFYTKRKKGGPWPTREGIGKNHWTCAEFYYIKRRDWRVYTCVCVQSTQGICLFVLSDEICVWDCVSTGNMENFCFLPQSLEIIGQFA